MRPSKIISDCHDCIIVISKVKVIKRWVITHLGNAHLDALHLSLYGHV